MSVAGGAWISWIKPFPSSKQTDLFYTTLLLNTRDSNAHAPPGGVYDTKVTATVTVCHWGHQVGTLLHWRFIDWSPERLQKAQRCSQCPRYTPLRAIHSISLMVSAWQGRTPWVGHKPVESGINLACEGQCKSEACFGANIP